MKTYFRICPFFKRLKEGEEGGLISYAKEPDMIMFFGRDFQNKRVEFVQTWRKLLIIDLTLIAFRFEWITPGKKRDGILCERFFLEYDDKPMRRSGSRVDCLSKKQAEKVIHETEVRR